MDLFSSLRLDSKCSLVHLKFMFLWFGSDLAGVSICIYCIIASSIMLLRHAYAGFFCCCIWCRLCSVLLWCLFVCVMYCSVASSQFVYSKNSLGISQGLENVSVVSCENNQSFVYVNHHPTLPYSTLPICLARI